MNKIWKRRIKRIAIGIAGLLLLGLLWPADQIIPVQGATTANWNHDTFWYHPWGRSGVHKGIDIFADDGTPALASVGGIVVYAGEIAMGGKIVLILGPKWRLHYYAHLMSRNVSPGEIVRQGDIIGAVGATGNAAGKPPHLHYSIVTTVPYPWRIRTDPQGWKKMIYLNPDRALRP